MSESILRRARLSGKCPPSLVLNEPEKDSNFEEAVAKVIDSKEFRIRSDPHVALDFLSVMEKSSSIDKVSLPIDTALKNQALQYRRCVVLALVGATNPADPSIERILASGFLTSLKSWLTDILANPTGSVDLLLHLLSNIVALPVSKSIIKESGMGKAIGTLDKHSICKGTPNEEAISRRVKAIKDAWQATVKSQKAKDEALQKNAKRSADKSSSPTSAKRAKADEPKKMSSFSSLIKKMSSNATKASPGEKLATALEKASAAEAEQKPVEKKKTNKRVKWVDHFGGEITATRIFTTDGEDVESTQEQVEKAASWSDRKKRDRERERELLAKAKKAKLMDDDDDGEAIPRSIATTAAWKTPLLLPERADISKAVLDSPETLAQDERMKTIAKAVYLAEHLVPPNPAPLTDIEQALDMTSQAAANVTTIPFFAPQEQTVLADTTFNDIATQQPTIPSMSALQPAPDSPATLEFAQSLGLPPYLAGHPVKTLQTLAASPGLLGTLVGPNGLYDQTKLMTLVHTLSANIAPPPAPYQPPVPAYNAPNPVSYNTGRGGGGGLNNYQHKKSDEGNLHVAGYGSMTTEAELIAAFSPYVKVDEVVMKSNFSFVNTSDPINAQRAREALTGTLVGGMPIRINAATRKKNNDLGLSAYGSGGGSMSQYPSPSAPPIAPSMAPPPPNSMPVVSVDNVRDDRGNPATKNLFVAGYGPNTTEQELRELFSLHAAVTGVVNKGTFSFVNTMDRAAAVNARQCLGGTMLNGGVLRINFAKETGRLGTSFDLTYNTNTGPHARGNNASRAGNGLSYYGRGGY